MFLFLVFGVVLKKITPVLSDIGLNFRALENSNGYPSAGYAYPQPLPPVNFDEPPPLSPPVYLPPSGVYLPPSGSPPSPIPPSGGLPEIFNDIPSQPSPTAPSAPTYLPPILYPPLSDTSHENDDTIVIPSVPPSQGYLPPPGGLYQTPNPHVKILNMSCMADFNFKCVFRMDSAVSPVLEEGSEDCMTKVSQKQFQIDLNSFNRMLKCGVKKCRSNNRENMCLMVRVPTVKGIRLPEDETVTFMCVPQEKVVSQTKHLRLGAKNTGLNARARSNPGLIATGGSKKDLKSRILILKKNRGSQVFDQTVQPDSVIQLGEELVLRAVVDDVDGWKNSLMGPVLVSSTSSKKSAILVNQNGCVSPQMRHVCPRSPKQLTPLDTELRFRAFLFEETPQGDEMIVSVRVQGCLHPQDCFRTENCDADPTVFGARSKRQAFLNQTSDATTKSVKNQTNITNWESTLYFKVIKIDQVSSTTQFLDKHNLGYLNILYVFLFSVILLLMGILLFFLMFPRYKH